MDPDQPTSRPLTTATAQPDLEAIAADLADVEVALARLDAGTYFLDEVTGEPLPEALLAERPTARQIRSGAIPTP